MARPGQLVEALAEQFGMSPATVTLHNRNLREAGVREKQNRGRGKGDVSALDAATLLISLLAGGQAKDSEASVKLYSRLKIDRYGPISDAPPSIAGLDQDHCFIDGLTTLIQSAVSGELQLWAEGGEGSIIPDIDTQNLIIEVRVFSPATRAQISLTPYRFVSEGEQRTPSIQMNYGRFVDINLEGKKKINWQATSQWQKSDLRQERLIGEKTVYRLATILRG